MEKRKKVPDRPALERCDKLERRPAISCIVLIALWHMGPEGACDSLSERVYPLFNLSAIQPNDIEPTLRFNLWQNRREGLAVLSFEEEDIFRKYIGKIRIANVSNRNLLLTLSLPLTVGRTRHWVTLQGSKGAFDYDGRSHSPGWRGRLSASGRASRLEYGVDLGRHRLVASVSWSRTSRNDQPFTISKFPHSETDRSLNRFFLDLLEPTFGQQVTYGLQDRSLNFEAGGILAVSDQSRLGVTAHLQNQETRANIRHTNTGSKTELQGTRRTDLLLKLDFRRYALSLERRVGQRWLVQGELGYATDRLGLELTPHNVPLSPRGVPLDFTELGNGSGSRRGVDLKARGAWVRSDRFRLAMVFGWGRSTYRGEAAGTTPVLGFRFGALPIAHKGDANLSGTIVSWAGGSQVQKQWGKIRLNSGVMLVRAEVTTRTLADADLEFGLYVHPVRDLSPYWMTLFRIFAAPSVQILPAVRAGYRATQHVVLLKGERKKVKVEGEKIRGGTFHTVMLAYLF